MLSFKKKIVIDEAMRPVAVLIDYQDWQKIEQGASHLGKNIRRLEIAVTQTKSADADFIEPA